MESRLVYEFEGFHLDPKHLKLTKDSNPIELEPKDLAVLRFLVEHPHEALATSAILKGVWGENVFVQPENVTVRISHLRKVIYRNDGRPLIDTQKSTKDFEGGYRFNADVQVLELFTSPRTQGARTANRAPQAITSGQPIPVPNVPCVGRRREIKKVVATLLRAAPASVAVLGPPGIGKSTIARASLNYPDVVRRYAKRRFLVRCDAALSVDALLSTLANTLGLRVGPFLKNRVFDELGREPAVLVLDNFETSWEATPDASEALLTELAGLGSLVVMVTLRGEDLPIGPHWNTTVHVRPLEPQSARELFFSVAGPRFRSDPRLGELLDPLGGVPLAIALMAYRSQAQPDLEGVKSQWSRKRTELLRRDGGRSPNLNLELSFEVSISGPRMTDASRQLLAVMGILPAGVAREDVSTVLPSDGEEAAAVLRSVALAFDEGRRLRLLAPLREYVARVHQPDPDALEPAQSHYVRLARELGPKVGSPGGVEAAARLAAEAANLEAAIELGLHGTDPIAAVRGALGVAEYQRHAGGASVALLCQSQTVARSNKKPRLEAQCIEKLGELMMLRSDYEGAKVCYEQALVLFRGAKDLLGRATCIAQLGEIALRRSAYDEAGARFEEALALFRRKGDLKGQGTCLRSLGTIALERSQHRPAKALLEEAKVLFGEVGYVHGEANCICRLGEIALERSEYEEAKLRLEEAMALYRDIGAVLGEANCIYRLGEIALERSEYEDAKTRFLEALPLFRRVQNVQGEGNCMMSLGELALKCSAYDDATARLEDGLALFRRIEYVLGEAGCIYHLGVVALKHLKLAEARARLEQALALYTDIDEPFSIGGTHRHLAHLALDAADRDRHLEEARRAWIRADRPDLIGKLDEEADRA